jgi:hypothetical protein
MSEPILYIKFFNKVVDDIPGDNKIEHKAVTC